MMPLGLSLGLAAASALGRSTCAADSIVTAVVTMKMISSTRKISVKGVILMSAKTPPLPLLGPLTAIRSASRRRVMLDLPGGRALGPNRDGRRSRRLGGVQDAHHVAEQDLAIALEDHHFGVDLDQRLAQARDQLA